MSEYKEAAYSFEAVKTGMSQSKDGIYLRMVIHPEDCPAKLLLDGWVKGMAWLWLRWRKMRHPCIKPRMKR